MCKPKYYKLVYIPEAYRGTQQYCTAHAYVGHFINVRDGAIKNGQSRETGNIGYTRRRQTKQKHNTICVGHHYIKQTHTQNINKI